ncbi:PspC domain-containing protein [Asanoa sp. NPDC049518]|uniref:PspC domain-containing protein n=1 Tax=unclassified Asanoa TaxID=2685164 RepID=UPI003433A8F7
MSAILADIGPVGDANPSPPRGRFWCRIDEKKWVGGICGGLAAYGELSLDWTRTIALALLVFRGGLLAIPYLVLLFVLPVVPTFAEYERRRDTPRHP